MKVSRLLIFSYLLFFALPWVFFSIIQDQTQKMKEKENQGKILQFARESLKHFQETSDTMTMYQTMFSAFLGDNFNSTTQLETKNKELLALKIFPPYDLFVACGEEADSQLFFTSGIGLSKKIGELFYEYLIKDQITKENENFLESSFKKILQLPIPLPKVLGNGRNHQGKLVFYNSLTGLKGLYWNLRACRFVLALIDFGDGHIDPMLGMKFSSGKVKMNDSISVVGGFFPRGEGEPIFPEEMSKYPSALAWLKKICKEPGENIPNEKRIDNQIILTGPTEFGIPWQAFVVAEINPPPISWTLTKKGIWMVSLLFMIGGSLGVFQGVYMNRGIRFTVSGVLLTSCISLLLIPVGSMIALSQNVVQQLQELDREFLSSKLKQDLTLIDSGVNYFRAGVVRDMKKLSLTGAIADFFLSRPSALRIRNFVEVLAGKARGNLKSQKSDNVEMLCTFGLGKTTGIWVRNDTHKGEGDNPVEIMPSLWKNLFKRLNKDLFLNDRDDFSNKRMDELRTEILFEVMNLALGRNSLAAITALLPRPSVIDVSQLKLSFMVNPIKKLGKSTGYFLLWLWTSWLDNGYLDFLKEEKLYCKSIASASTASIFEKLADPDVFPRGWVATLFGIGQNYIRAGGEIENRPFKMMSSFFEIDETGIPKEGKDETATGAPLFAIFPGKELSLFVLGTYRFADWLELRSWFYNNSFKVLSILAIFLAILLSKRGIDHFLNPLKELRNSLAQIENGKYDTRLDEKRKDEFGTIGAAFNTMAKGLEEGKILGSYVSASVRKAVEDGDFRVKARQGERRETTILFSSLLGFEDLRENMSNDKIISVLSEHLRAFNDAIAELGGDIDKVMADKVLAVFDHEKLGGGEKALEIALRCLAFVRKRLQPQGIELAVGINSGEVIAGILGAKSDKQTYTVIGDPVNLASRLALLAHTVEGTRIVISGAAVNLLNNKLPVQKLPFKRVKGKTQEVQAYVLEAEPSELLN
ncbi:MAG: HAMP domain-containing protein [Candidatus Riflebacteria bacterium]|nr:HAMP domain-containing protein [Candidatus Riflebacteria bacterium]